MMNKPFQPVHPRRKVLSVFGSRRLLLWLAGVISVFYGLLTTPVGIRSSGYLESNKTSASPRFIDSTTSAARNHVENSAALFSEELTTTVDLAALSDVTLPILADNDSDSINDKSTKLSEESTNSRVVSFGKEESTLENATIAVDVPEAKNASSSALDGTGRSDTTDSTAVDSTSKPKPINVTRQESRTDEASLEVTINKDPNETDTHRSDLAYLPLLPWEVDSLQFSRSCRPPNDGTPSYCCVGSSTRGGHFDFAVYKCNKGPDVYARAEEYAQSQLLLTPIVTVQNRSDQKVIECDWCRIIDLLSERNWTMTFLGDSVTGQSFIGAECELRRRGYIVTKTGPVGWQPVNPEQWHVYTVSRPLGDGSANDTAVRTVVLQYCKIYQFSHDLVEVDEVMLSGTNIVVFDNGLHYGPDLSAFEADSARMMQKIVNYGRAQMKLVAWRETNAQNYDTLNGHFERGGNMQNCVAMNLNYPNNASQGDDINPPVIPQTSIMQRILSSIQTNVSLQQQAVPTMMLPFWSYTQALQEIHPGSGDCSHYCSSPSMWLYLWRELRNAVELTVLRDVEDTRRNIR